MRSFASEGARSLTGKERTLPKGGGKDAKDDLTRTTATSGSLTLVTDHLLRTGGRVDLSCFLNSIFEDTVVMINEVQLNAMLVGGPHESVNAVYRAGPQKGDNR